jgi:hypothetical protein
MDGNINKVVQQKKKKKFVCGRQNMHIGNTKKKELHVLNMQAAGETAAHQC